MLLNNDEMNNNNYVIPTAVLQKLIDAARYGKWRGDPSTVECHTEDFEKVDVQLTDVLGLESLFSQLVHIEESSPPSYSSSSASSSSSDVASDAAVQQVSVAGGVERARKSSKSPTVVVVNPARYKTELCRQFEEHGSCRYGEKCQFAHGSGELRTLVRHPKYKTEMCRTFHTTGFCPYGLRCHFIHNDEERRTASISLDSGGRRRDATVTCGLASPPGSVPGDGSLAGLTTSPPYRPSFRSSTCFSPTPSISCTELDPEQRGRPILARSSTLPEPASLTYLPGHLPSRLTIGMVTSVPAQCDVEYM